MNGLLKTLADKWNGLSNAKKSIIVVMSAAVILAGIFFVQWLTREEYAPLFSDLEPKQANAVVEKLKELKVPYKLENQGTTISVPKEKVYEARIELAGAGVLTQTGLGFELFDQSKLGQTPFEREVDYQRALQEELRRTIVAFDEVEQARVHLVLPKESVFVEEEQPASAAITLKMRPLAKLNAEQVKGIIYLVSSSVQNLPPENVKVIDTTGRVLSDEVSVGEANLTQIRLDQYELKRQYEKDLEKRVQGMLSTVFGPGKSIVMVSADLDFDRVEEKTLDYGDGSIVGQQTSTEQSTNTGGAGGVVGAPNVTPQVPGYVAGGQGNSSYQKQDTTTNYNVDQTERHTVRAQGQLRSLSVSVVVDGQLTQAQVTQIEGMVATAIGLQPLRGDQINVTGMAFENNAGLAEQPAGSDSNAQPAKIVFPPYFKWVGLGAALFLLLLLVLARRRKKKAAAALPVVEEVVPVTPVEPVVPQISPEERARKEKQQHLKDIVRQKPEEAAQLIKVWLAED
ncbi:flagellar basal-body MS-ring/collar protein FliF [Zhaonella formicivorans]|uniref:flagellar basal-body MS-ring/collar protein FliF n=1 Tax=Zhaonella formicivorans TaxID=2528593 RepID=UPI001D1035FD|nr:flagellar basal-body MS-ring/collar protein FliF [Zhaonella formicivorans]